jgi:hypothetical protein
MPTRHKKEWEAIARVFKDSPDAAYQFARTLYLGQHGLLIAQGKELDGLIEVLFPYTDFYTVSHHLYWLAVRGRLHPNYYPDFLCNAVDPGWLEDYKAHRTTEK